MQFDEAIASITQRGVVLPNAYYGSLQALHKHLSFSIAGIAKVDQLQAVLDSLANTLKTGGTFAEWQKTIAVQDLRLPQHRLDNIFRTNIQQAYNHGQWLHALEHKDTRPYMMYDAINDSRTRPSHSANDGIIRRIDDPIWKSIWFGRSVYRCRCRLISLSERQAIERSKDADGLNNSDIGLNKQPTLDPNRDITWQNIDVMNVDILGVGVERVIANKILSGKTNPVLLNNLLIELASQPKPDNTTQANAV